METVLKKSFKSNFEMKTKLDTTISLGHEGKNTFSCEICGKNFHNKSKLAEYMRERNHSDVIFVTTDLLERVS